MNHRKLLLLVGLLGAQALLASEPKKLVRSQAADDLSPLKKPVPHQGAGIGGLHVHSTPESTAKFFADLDKANENTIDELLAQAKAQGISLEVKNSRGLTPLLFVGTHDKPAWLFHKLLAAGADINAAYTATGTTLLHGAAQAGDEDSVQKLLALKADINAQDKHGMTPLMAALLQKNTEVIKCLMQHNPDLSLQDRNGDTAHDFAQESGDVTIVETFNSITTCVITIYTWQPTKRFYTICG